MTTKLTNSPVLITILTTQSQSRFLHLLNKAFRVLIEIVALKWPDQCLPMVQYAAELCDNIGRFPFPVSYNYDVKFGLKRQSHPHLSWNEIDNRLRAKCFTCVKESNPSDAFSSHKKRDSSRAGTRTCFDFQLIPV